MFAVFWSDEKDSSEFSLIMWIATNIQSNLSGSSLERDLLPLQLEINLFSQFSVQVSVIKVLKQFQTKERWDRPVSKKI